jgi:hypothetical protein
MDFQNGTVHEMQIKVQNFHLEYFYCGGCLTNLSDSYLSSCNLYNYNEFVAAINLCQGQRYAESREKDSTVSYFW